MSTYKLTRTASVVRLPDLMEIPSDPANRDWQEYQAWLLAGNTPLPADAALVSPDQSDIDNLDKALKALALLTRQYGNQIKAGTFLTKSVADVRADFMAICRALP